MTRQTSQAAEGPADGDEYESSKAGDRQNTPGNQFERRVAAIIGDDRSVLIIGATPQSLRSLLEERGCRITAPPEGLTEGSYPDVQVVLALELFSDEGALKSTLESFRARLRDGGFLVTGFRNDMHGGRRISRLLGREPEVATPQPFAMEKAAVLLAKHQFAIGCVERDMAPVVAPADADRELLSDELLKGLNADMDAATVHYIVAAHPTPWPGMNWLHRRSIEQSAQTARAEKACQEANEQSEALHGRLRELILLQEGARSVERDLREQLLAAHERLESRDRELQETYLQLTGANQKLAGMRASIPGTIGQWADSLRNGFRRR